MDAYGLELYKLVRKKDYTWINTVITQLRLYTSPIYPVELATKNRAYINCMQSLEFIENKFKHSEFKKHETPFHTLPIMHKIINILCEMMLDAPPKADIKANDPIAISKKQEDINRLKTRKIYEQGQNRALGKIGEPPVKMDDKKYHSNIDLFDKLQLDEGDEGDVNVFQTYLQRLDYEVHAQNAVNGVFKVNKFDELNLRDAVIDVAATLCLCYDVYVDRITGQQKIDRIYPEDTRGIWGVAYDGREDICKGWEKPVPLRTFLGMVGDSFDMQRDWMDLIWAINFANNTTFTGLRFGNYTYDTWDIKGYENYHSQYGCQASNVCFLDQSYHYNVYVGKLQFYAPDAYKNFMVEKSTDTPTTPTLSYEDFLKSRDLQKKYNYESKIRWVSYDATYLAFGQTQQKIYQWGETYLQQPEGAYDEYCIGTFKYLRLGGLTIAEVAKPYIDIANEVFYKIKWIIDKATPRKRTLVFNEIIQMARAFQTDKGGLLSQNGQVQNNTTDLLEKVFNYLENHVEYDIRFYPQVRGQEIPQVPSLKSAEEGIDPLMTAMQLLMQWAEQQVADKIGLNDLRMGNITNPRDGYKRQEEATQFSLKSTSYIYRLMQYLKREVATTVLIYVHDVIKYKQSIPAKWLKDFIGHDAFEGLQDIKNVSPHRFAIFINDYFSQKRKQEVDQAATMALQKGEQNQMGGITLDQWFAITEKEDYVGEMKLLTIFRKKEDKKRQQQEIKMKMLDDQLDKNRHDREMEEINAKGEIELRKASLLRDAEKYSADKQYQSKIDTQNLKMESEPSRQEIRKENQKDIATHKANLEEQKPFEE